MFWPILRFEVTYHIRRPVTYLYCAILFLLAFFVIASDAVSLTGGVGLVKRNGPYALAQAVILLTAFGQVITTALVGTSLLRDYRFRVHELLFTTHMSRLGYLGGRFGGAFLVMVLIFSAIPVGTLLGAMAPWVDGEFLLPINPWWHAQPFLLFGVPTLLAVSAIFFAVGALTRSLIAVYTAGFGLLVAYSVTQTWLEGLDRDALSNAFDVFGLATLELTTRYWTVAERNSLTIPLDGFVLANRAIWIAVGLAIAAATFSLFRFKAGADQAARKRKSKPEAPTAPSGRSSQVPAFGARTTWRQLTATAIASFKHIVRDKTFIAIALIASANTFMNAWYVDSFYGATTWPVTYLVAEVVVGGFFLFMVILTTIYAGEAVWRERAFGADQLVDSAPVDTWILTAGKIVSVILALTVVMFAMVPVGIAAQLAKGFTDIDVGLYVTFILATQLPWVVAVTLFAFVVHSLAQNKFVGHVVLILYWVGSAVISSLGVEHQLAAVGWSPGFTFSDMNGFGHFVSNLALSGSYSVTIGLMVTVIAVLAWARGTDTDWRQRLEVARAHWTPRTGLALGGCAALAVVFGGAIFYNTNVLNTYTTSDEREESRAEWERTYRPFIHLVPPRVIDVDVTVELWPERRAYSRDGRYIVVNKHEAAIDSVLVNYPPLLSVERMEWGIAAHAAITDTITGTYLWTFDDPLQPGDTTEFRYRLTFEAKGFPNSAPNNRIVANGTFLAGAGPALGYDESGEMIDPADRRKHDLPPKDRLPDLDDPQSRRNSQFSIDSDNVRFAATIGTAPNQIAVAPGYLVREWEENGRRWFRYVMDRPMTNFVSFVSAEYTVARDRWNDVDTAVYYHETHDYNIDLMIESVKASLDYYTENFSPYQFGEVRVLEFPRYSGFAQSFPTTIPYSESIGFITRVMDDDDDLDMPFFVTAHEVAHQWWGHQVVGARAQGSAIMVESMAEYSALTVMEQRYGPSHARKFLRYELDTYLRGRSSERIREQPLMRTESQAYIHYNKGSLALYALRDYIGEEAMNRGLRGYLEHHAYETAPYSTSREFLSYLRSETPDSLQYVIEDLFETITLWDNRAEEIEVTERPDGRYAVKLDFTARKVRADSVGNEIEIPMSDYVDVGVFGTEEPGNSLGRPLSVYKILVTEGRSSVDIIVDERPVKAGIDPYNKLIDRVPDDNVKDVPGGA